MRFLYFLFILTSITLSAQTEQAEDFDIEAIPGLIEQFETIEELEKAINDSINEVNNLDLNNDDIVDFIGIHEYVDGDVHVLVLRAFLSEDDAQDIATIEMEKISSTTATFQIVGEESIYGADYILEPEDDGIVDISSSASPSSTSGFGGPNVDHTRAMKASLAVRVTFCVGIYRPGRVVYVTPYGFVVRPAWYHPRRVRARSAYRARYRRWHRTAVHRTRVRRSHRARAVHYNHHRTRKNHYNNHSNKSNTHNKSNSKHNKHHTPSTRGRRR